MSPPLDVAIVGAGPAGAWTAYRLARRGARVAIFDASHPREKPCGGGVTGRALALVAEAVDLGRLPAVVITAARFGDTGVHPADVPLVAAGLSPASQLVVSSRAAFDRALLDAAMAAGARHEVARVRDVLVAPDGVTLDLGSRRVTARLVVGADGATSLVRRRVARPFTRAQLSIAAGVYAHGASSSTIDLHFSSDPPGYLWSFPRPDHLAIGACAQADLSSSAALHALTRRWVGEADLAPSARLQEYAWPIPSLSPADVDAERPGGPRWLLVGDAAGLVDPITREGIYFALASATAATDAIAQGPSPWLAYEASLRRHIYPELRRAARLKAGFFRGAFTGLVVEALRESPRVRAVMADLVAGTQPYASLRGRLLRTFELRLAWRLLRVAGAPRAIDYQPPGTSHQPRASHQPPARRAKGC